MSKILYHGTREWSYKNIIKNKYIYISGDTNYSTDTINDAIERYTSENPRVDAIFLTDDANIINCYDKVIEINLNDLNKNQLYVADLNLADEIYLAILEGYNKKIIKHYIRKYMRSFVEYSKYEKIEKEYKKYHTPEFLYFDDIKINN